MNSRLFQDVAIVGAALLAGCMASIIKTDDISDFYQVKTVSGSLLNRQHAQILVRSEGGNSEYLGSINDPEWAEKFPFGFSGLYAKNIAISSDGRSIVYEHKAGLEGDNSHKEGGLYSYEYGIGEKLLRRTGEFSIPAAHYSKPLPSDILVISRSGKTQAVSASGEIFPLLLVGGSRLHQAAFDGDTQSISRIVREDSSCLDALTYWGMTPLEVAVLNGKEAAAIQLLLLGASYRKDDDSLIYIASAYKRSIVVEELLQRKAPFNYLTKDGNTPIHATLRFLSDSAHYPDRPVNDEATISVLSSYLKHGANINMRDGEGRTLLHLTFSVPIARFLIDRGINPNATDDEGNTALHHAVAMEIDEQYKGGWEERMLPLLELIAPKMKTVDGKNNHGASPLQRAIQSNHVRTADYLIAHGADASVAFIHSGLGPKIPGQTIQDRIESIKKGEWWKEKS